MRKSLRGLQPIAGERQKVQGMQPWGGAHYHFSISGFSQYSFSKDPGFGEKRAGICSDQDIFEGFFPSSWWNISAALTHHSYTIVILAITLHHVNLNGGGGFLILRFSYFQTIKTTFCKRLSFPHSMSPSPSQPPEGGGKLSIISALAPSLF